MVGDPVKAKGISDILLADFGVYVQPINYPTVPRGTERLRFTPARRHEAMMHDLVAALVEIWAGSICSSQPSPGTGAAVESGANASGENTRMSEHQGSCHCGRIRLILREAPSDAGECNCSICRRTAGLWHYCPPDTVTVEGEGVSTSRAIAHSTCGIARPAAARRTGRRPIQPISAWGSTFRMFDPALWRDLPRRLDRWRELISGQRVVSAQRKVRDRPAVARFSAGRVSRDCGQPVHLARIGGQQVDRRLHQQRLHRRRGEMLGRRAEDQVAHAAGARVGGEFGTKAIEQRLGLGAGHRHRIGAERARRARDLGEISVLVGAAHARLDEAHVGVEEAQRARDVDERQRRGIVGR